MGKKKFINKQNAATLRMMPSGQEGTKGLTCFQKIDEPGANQSEQQKELSHIIEKELNKGKFTNLKPRMPEIDHAKEALSLVQGRNDLWINQLQRQKLMQQQQLQGVVMKQYDENGLPIDGYNYNQHLVSEKPEGEVQCVFEVPVEERQHIIYDIDFKREELNDDQKEVYDLLMEDEEKEQNEDEQQNPENQLEDDFVSKLIRENDSTQQQQQQKIESPKKQVRFQESESDNDEDYEDEEEEEEIPYEKPKQQQQQKQQSKQQYKQQQNDSESDIEIDSDMEREFEREMKAYDEEEVEEQQNDEKNGDLMLNQVVEDHLKTMGEKKKKKGKRHQLESPEETEEQKQQRLEYLRNTDYNEYLRQKFPNADFSQFHLKKEIPQLTQEEDIALQNYLNRESSDDECPDMEPAEKYVETITSKSLHNTTMSKMNPDELNIIKFKGKDVKIKTKEEKQKEKIERKQKIQELKEEKEKIKENLCETLKQVVIKKDETKEEKKQRKELLKQLKQAQKEKKKAFKEQLQQVSKSLQKQKLANIQSNQAEGISIIKIA